MQIMQPSLDIWNLRRSGRLHRHLSPLAAVALLMVGLACVAGAPGDQGAHVCLSDAWGPATGAAKKTRIDYLVGDALGRQRRALHLRGSWQEERNAVMMARMQKWDAVAAESSRPSFFDGSRA